ncbi:MAG: phosphatase PAP2 family protein [Cyclobacteriaceae bacterium]|nr:phosphatase PAP2 family protein [Cyclobacteriaceae bacterium]UYN85981.1 MAG: phosphatase PAP2 family protein [Cyclobacteriaceae bacterium]
MDTFLTWASAWHHNVFRKHLILTLGLLVACALAAPHIFRFVEAREGYVLPDPVLVALPAKQVSVYIFVILYIFIGMAIIILVQSPKAFLTALQAYLLITLFRFVTLLLVPLEAPPGLLPLQDPLVDKLFYQQPVTKDLFFSGHTGILALFFFLLGHNRQWNWLFGLASLAVGILLLVQHAHYTLDVLAAPAFAWLAVKVSPKLKV